MALQGGDFQAQSADIRGQLSGLARRILTDVGARCPLAHVHGAKLYVRVAHFFRLARTLDEVLLLETGEADEDSQVHGGTSLSRQKQP